MTETTSLTPLVELKSLNKGFDGKQIISELDLTIRNGEFLTILGPSGCGKTTVLRLIAGLEDVDEGQIILDGQDITDIPAEQRFDVLDGVMQDKHQIKQPVCLYTQNEFAQMLAEAGWRIDTIYASALGNIKAIASKE